MKNYSNSSHRIFRTIALFSLLLLFATLVSCHSTVPLDPVGTENTRSDSTLPSNQAATSPDNPDISTSGTQAQTERATAPDENKTTASERITEPLDIEDDEPARPITIEVAKLGELTFEDDPSEDRQAVQFCDMKMYLTYGDYVIGSDIAYCPHWPLGGQKYNVKTGVISSLCTDPYCTHDNRVLLEKSPEESCPFGTTGNYYFVWENKVYYNRIYILSSETPDWGTYHTVFASYDIATGEYKAIHDYSFPYNYRTAENERMPSDMPSRWLLYGDHAYTLIYRPTTTKPQGTEDYRRMLVRLDLHTNKEENILDVTELLDSADSLTFIREYTCYFFNVNSSLMTMLNMKTGEVTKVSLCKNTSDGPVARQGFGLYGEWFYCMYSPNQSSSNQYLTRINLQTGRQERLSDAILSSLLGMDEQYIYVSLAKQGLQESDPWIDITFPMEDHDHPGNVFVRFDKDTQKMKVLGPTNVSIGVITGGKYIGSNKYFDLETGGTYEIKYDSMEGGTKIVLDLTPDNEYLQHMEALGYR